MRQHFTAPVRLQPGFGSITYTGPNRRKPYLARRTQAKGHKADSYIGYFPTWYDAYTAILNDHVSHPSGEKKNGYSKKSVEIRCLMVAGFSVIPK